MYKLYSDDFIECVYCNKICNLYYAKKHINTKSCKFLQGLLSEDEKNILMIKYNKQINKLKCEIQFNKLN